MKTSLLYRPLLSLALILSMGLGVPHGDEGEPEDDEDQAEVTVDTCGWLAGHRVTVTTSLTHHNFGMRESYEGSISIGLEILKKNGASGDGKSVDTTLKAILQWPVYEYGDGLDAPTAPTIKAQKNSLRFMSDGRAFADFVYKKDRLWMTPDFRRKIIRELEADTGNYWPEYLERILSAADWPDKHILQVMRLYPIRDSIRQGYVDGMLAALQVLKEQAVDDTIARYCKRLSDSLTAAKKSVQPLKLVAARKVGIILNDPIYPPLDSPSVFWQDSLLAVVKEETGKPRMMRTFDPASGKWGKEESVRYPETAMSKMFQIETECSEKLCWRKKLGKTEDPCSGRGLDCHPLIQLDDSVDGGSIRNFSDLAKAGGSCAAGWGLYEFREAGSLYNLIDEKWTDEKVKWEVFPGPLLSGTREYGFEPARIYPVVVSPYQDWVAYAMASKDGKSKELWVARLKYRE